MVGLPMKAKIGIRSASVSIDPATYFLAKRMEDAGRLQPGQALMLAATLNKTRSQARSKTKRGAK